MFEKICQTLGVRYMTLLRPYKILPILRLLTNPGRLPKIIRLRHEIDKLHGRYVHIRVRCSIRTRRNLPKFHPRSIGSTNRGGGGLSSRLCPAIEGKVKVPSVGKKQRRLHIFMAKSFHLLKRRVIKHPARFIRGQLSAS